jgi:hypothetical protein
MDRDAEALPHRLGHGARCSCGILGALLLDKVQDLVGTLVRTFGPAWPRQQTREPARGEGRLRGIEGLPAHAEGGGDLGDGARVHAVPAKHLVLHLHLIAPVEKLVAREGLISHGRGARMQRAGGLQRGDLGIRGRGTTAPGHGVNDNTYIWSAAVKGIVGHTPGITSEYSVPTGRAHVALRR